MGRITIFSIEDCNFCRHAKSAFSARGIPYTDINIESYPSKRTDMISLTDQTSVPQVFFNDNHVGGSEEALAMLAKWDEEIARQEDCEDKKSPHDHYVKLIESEPDPTDERLATPTGPPAAQANFDFTTPRTKDTFAIDDKKYTTLELTKILVQNIPRESLTYWGCMYYNVFEGFDCVTALQNMFQFESREEAAQLGMKLQRMQYLGHVCKEHVFGDNGFYFRLQVFDSPAILNTFRIWCDPVEDEAMQVIHRLGKLWSKLESKHLNEDGMVDHATIYKDDLYWKFEEEVCELQCISLKDMDDTTKMAFALNVYNLMIKYAFVKVGIAATSTNRSSFFGDVSVNVGGCTFSLDELEHGIMRANTRHPYKLRKPFGRGDQRKHLAVKKLDPRVHFALNCGAKSCPPVKKYTAEAIDEELRLAAMAFCEQDGNVLIDEEKSEVSLSKILFWYMADFVSSKGKLPKFVVQYLRGEKKERLAKLIEQGGFTVKFLDYDWSSNDINFVEFEKSHLSDKSIWPYSANSRPEKYGMMVDGQQFVVEK